MLSIYTSLFIFNSVYFSSIVLHHYLHVHVHRAAVKRIIVNLLIMVAAVAGTGREIVLLMDALVACGNVIVIVEQHHFFMLVLARALIVPAVGHSIVEIVGILNILGISIIL